MGAQAGESDKHNLANAVDIYCSVLGSCTPRYTDLYYKSLEESTDNFIQLVEFLMLQTGIPK